MELIHGAPLWLAATNFWVIRSSTSQRECVLVDVPPEPAKVIKFVKDANLKVVAIIATHGHIDHIGGIPTVVEEKEFLDDLDHQKIRVIAHKNDIELIRDPIGSSAMLGQALLQARLSTKIPELIEYLDDDVTFSGAGLSFDALHTPGHTQGSTCFKVKVEGLPPLIFTGDHLFAGSIGRTDLPGGSLDSLMESLVTKILPLSDDTVVLPGHGPSTTIGTERLTNPYIQEAIRTHGR
ncbi:MULTISPECIES: MBL fold metallo-hydrolase [Acidithrix]|uniref:Putative metallo-hydrolase n=1 Tax=Acidithrix ferrooxidans TaxID=1280514 RepID=A0A0D8HGN8_9ACTN|nr:MULTISPECIES: MBL fold metallo-hydrolase [Acidithrix]KJF17088.1 putative metallo-hydrolase [Acidithrix ferrooxidans]CAG4923349.1 unnamed protein product [Acidithrix sp. C25]